MVNRKFIQLLLREAAFEAQLANLFSKGSSTVGGWPRPSFGHQVSLSIPATRSK